MLSKYELVEYIAQDEGHTIAEAAEHFKVSTSTIQKTLAKVRKKDAPDYSEYLAAKLKLAQEKVSLRGHKKGGTNGKRGRNLSDEDIKLYIEAYLSGQTLRSLSDLSGIPVSTLSDYINSTTDPELKQRIAEYNQDHNRIIIDFEAFRGDPWKR